MVSLRSVSSASLFDTSPADNNTVFAAQNTISSDIDGQYNVSDAVYSTASATSRAVNVEPMTAKSVNAKSTNVYKSIKNPESSAALSGDTQRPVLVEMFLSQSCSSCVPAARYVRDLAKRDDVVVLSWHVDYWDRLNTHNGRWKDPYSDKSYTIRQRSYGINKQTNGRIYTPQAVIDGREEMVGSRRTEIESTIKNQSQTTQQGILSVERKGNKLMIELGEGSTLSEAWLVSFTRETQTSILGGENAGLNWNEANVVFDIKDLGPMGGGAQSLEIKMPASIDDKKTGCAIVVQSKSLGPVTHAAYCPS